jgi:two-component system sensor histidine kinase UhpB
VAAVQHGFNQMAAALREAGDRNRQLTRELLRVQEEERRTIARELHDEFAQHVTAIDAEAAALAHAVQGKPEAIASVLSIRTGAQSLMRMVRGRLAQLRPEVLDEFGIIVAIEDLCESFANSYSDIVVETSLPKELPISEERSIAVFRILQESLTNVGRHAKASAVRITLNVDIRQGERVLEMTVVDNGVGLPATPQARLGFGLLGMNERLESLGGSLEVGPGSIGRGVAVHASLPLPERG